MASAASRSSVGRIGPPEAGHGAARPSNVSVRFGAWPATALSGTTGRPGTAGPIECTVLVGARRKWHHFTPKP